MKPFIKKQKQPCLKDFLEKTLISILPYQDAGMILELFLVYFNQLKEFDYAYILTKHQKQKLLKKLIKPSEVNNKDFLEPKIIGSRFIYFPIKIHKSLTIDTILKLSKNTSYKEIKENLAEVHYYITVFMDRANYIALLTQQNNILANLNRRMRAVNKSLKQQLKRELKNQFYNYNTSQELIKDHTASEITKQLCHEINNPLSILKFDALTMKDNNIQADKDLVMLMARYYNVDSQDLMAIIEQKKDCQKTHNNRVFLKKYPMINQYNRLVNQNEKFHQMNDSHIIAITHISNLVSTIAYQAIGNTHKNTTLELNNVINECITLFKRTCEIKRINIVVIKSKQPCVIVAKKVLIFQIIINLIKNSIESMRVSTNHSLKIILKRLQSQCLLQITDTGAGFSELDLVSLIKKGPTRVGLGVPIIKSLVKSLKGHIVWRKKNPGTVVAITIPIITNYKSKSSLDSGNSRTRENVNV